MADRTPFQVEVSERGFAMLVAIEHAAYGGTAIIRESSAAFDPSLWLDVAEPVDLNQAAVDHANGVATAMKDESTLHLRAWQARRLRDALDYALEDHYQGDVRRYNAEVESPEHEGLHD